MPSTIEVKLKRREISPCPFCDTGSPVLDAVYGTDRTPLAHWWKCSNGECMATGPVGKTIPEATDKWNTHAGLRKERQALSYHGA